jgi:membrane fusion protein (multidrug efflux system)
MSPESRLPQASRPSVSATLERDTHTPPRARRVRARARELVGRKLARRILLAIVVLVVAIVGYRYWRHAQLYVTTDDAYVNADTIDIAPQVAGPVVAIHVRDNQHVNVDDALFEIDPRPYDIALKKAQAQLQLASQGVSQDSAAVAAAQAQVRRARRSS